MISSVLASILQELPDGGQQTAVPPTQQINSVKVEHGGYYCSTGYAADGDHRAPPPQVDPMAVSAAAYSAMTQVVSSTSPSAAIFYQHSPDQHGGKYGTTVENGHDTLSDFVTFVCQEAEGGPPPTPTAQQQQHSPKSQYFPAAAMLPPAPLPPMARPVAIIRSTGEPVTGSPPQSMSPPGMDEAASPHDEGLMGGPPELSPSPPTAGGGGPTGAPSPDRRKSPVRYSPVRATAAAADYATFNHFHAQPGHVGSSCDGLPTSRCTDRAASPLLQIFTYPSMSTMSGVISPTNLSMYSSAVSSPRSTARCSQTARWPPAPFIAIDQDQEFNGMMAPPPHHQTDSTATVMLMDDVPVSDRYFQPASVQMQADVQGDGSTSVAHHDTEAKSPPR